MSYNNSKSILPACYATGGDCDVVATTSIVKKNRILTTPPVMMGIPMLKERIKRKTQIISVHSHASFGGATWRRRPGSSHQDSWQLISVNLNFAHPTPLGYTFGGGTTPHYFLDRFERAGEPQYQLCH